MDPDDIQEKLREVNESIYAYERKMAGLATRDRLTGFTPLPTQQRYFESTNDPGNHLTIFYGPNGCGKSKVCGACISSEALGWEPWSGRKRPMHSDVPYPIGLLLPDYDNHARKFLEQDLRYFHREEAIRIERTHEGAPRRIFLKDPVTGRDARHPINIYTSKQDVSAQEAPNLQALYADEPCDRAHYIALSRGLRGTGGKTRLFGTLVSEPWMQEEILERCGNNGGELEHYVALRPDWRENIKEYGGYVPLADFERFWEKCDPDELQARKFGDPLDLTGRVYHEFDSRVHVITEDLVPDEVLATCPRVLVVDPHPRRPFAMIWAYVTPEEEIVVYDEWPSYEEVGDFHRLRTSRSTWMDYAREIAARGPCVWNIMDPNAGRAPSSVGGPDISSRLSQALLAIGDHRGFSTDVDDDLTVGHTAVKQRLVYDKDRPLSYENRPSLFFMANCKQAIKGMRLYTWDDFTGRQADLKGLKPKPRERNKDFPDAVRYLCVSTIQYLDVSRVNQRRSRRSSGRRPAFHRSFEPGRESYGSAIDFISRSY